MRGVPEDGYVPGRSYELRLSWPDFAERARAIRESGSEPASISVVAEFVAESGQGAGRLEIASADDADERELCVLPAGEQAAQLYGVKPGEPTAEWGTTCDTSGLGHRCLVATLSCGAEELRFTWTAPDSWQGTIFFAAGMVATEEVSGDPSGDSVTEILLPIQPAASTKAYYETTLKASCSSAPSAARHVPLWPAALGLLLWVLQMRRRWSSRWD